MRAAPADDAPTRLAVVVTHPIQHFTPFYRAIAADPAIALKVFFCARIGLERYFDREMGVEIKWAMDLVGGYDHEFLPGAEAIKGIGRFNVDNPGVGAALARFAPDAVLLHGYAQPAMLRALAWARGRSVPVLLFGESHLRQRRSWVRVAAKEIPMRLLAGQFAAILTISDASEQYWRRYGAVDERLFRSPSTIDELAYRNARRNRVAMRAEVRGQLGLSDDRVVALSVGKLTERKRPTDLVEAAALLAREGWILHCMFAGDGELKEALQARIAETGVPASLLGFVNVDRLPMVYACADVLVHPAASEAFGYVANEAACVGLPIIASDRMGAVGPTSVARPGRNAATYPCEDIAALAAELRRVAFDPALLARMGQASCDVFDELDMRRSLAGLKAALAAGRRTSRRNNASA